MIEGRRREILSFEEAEIPFLFEDKACTSVLNETLEAGQTLLCRLYAGVDSLPLADTAQGLAKTRAGGVSFLGRPWAKLSAREQDNLRGKTGRVFSRGGWVSNLSVMENITLRLRYYSTENERVINQRVFVLAEQLGLRGEFEIEPERMPKTGLRLAAWVRAFVGDPRLIVLEQPMEGLAERHLASLLLLAKSAIRKGAAILWITRSDSVWSSEMPFAVRRIVHDGNRFIDWDTA